MKKFFLVLILCCIVFGCKTVHEKHTVLNLSLTGKTQDNTKKWVDIQNGRNYTLNHAHYQTQAIISNSGHEVFFFQKQNKWFAIVNEKQPTGNYKRWILPVIYPIYYSQKKDNQSFLPTYTVEKILQLSPQEQKSVIHIMLPKIGEHEGFVLIGKQGLQGGGVRWKQVGVITANVAIGVALGVATGGVTNLMQGMLFCASKNITSHIISNTVRGLIYGVSYVVDDSKKNKNAKRRREARNKARKKINEFTSKSDKEIKTLVSELNKITTPIEYQKYTYVVNKFDGLLAKFDDIIDDYKSWKKNSDIFESDRKEIEDKISLKKQEEAILQKAKKAFQEKAKKQVLAALDGCEKSMEPKMKKIYKNYETIMANINGQNIEETIKNFNENTPIISLQEQISVIEKFKEEPALQMQKEDREKIDAIINRKKEIIDKVQNCLDIIKEAKKNNNSTKFQEILDNDDIFKAVKHGFLPLIKYFFISNKVSINKKQQRLGNTSLHIAVKRQYILIIKYLLSNNADPTIQNRRKKTPYDLAKESGDPEIIQLFENSK